MKKIKTLIIRLTTEEHKKLKIEAIERNIPMSQLVKQSLIIYTANYNQDGIRK